MSGWFSPLPRGLADRCKRFAEGLTLVDEQKENLPDGKGVVHRVRFSWQGDPVVRTEVRTLMAQRIYVDIKPVGAVLIILEVAKRGSAPGRLVALTGDKAGEYAQGAFEATWGAMMLGGSGGGPFPNLRFKGEPRTIRLPQLAELAETVL